jgi:hypothetical protein
MVKMLRSHSLETKAAGSSAMSRVTPQTTNNNYYYYYYYYYYYDYVRPQKQGCENLLTAGQLTVTDIRVSDMASLRLSPEAHVFFVCSRLCQERHDPPPKKVIGHKISFFNFLYYFCLKYF